MNLYVFSSSHRLSSTSIDFFTFEWVTKAIHWHYGICAFVNKMKIVSHELNLESWIRYAQRKLVKWEIVDFNLFCNFLLFRPSSSRRNEQKLMRNFVRAYRVHLYQRWHYSCSGLPWKLARAYAISTLALLWHYHNSTLFRCTGQLLHNFFNLTVRNLKPPAYTCFASHFNMYENSLSNWLWVLPKRILRT